MGKERNTEGASGWAVATAVAFLVIPILYLLGIGPMNWLVNRDYVSVGFANGIYGWLIALAIEDNWLGRCLQAYLRLWQ